MAKQTPEGRVKAAAKKLLEAHGAYFFMPVSNGMGSHGIPDILACLNGRFIGIEAKAGKNKPTDLQTLNLKRIDEAGGLALVINEENLNQLEFILEAAHPRSNYQLFARPLTETDTGTGTPVKRKPKEA
jgi:Holliday junction resolvase